MQTQLTPQWLATRDGRIAEEALRKCVHCGFCNATCPTYRVFGDELDGPRGRIYQIKQVLEGQAATPIVQQHLDRCIGCLHCETTCPSGVPYGELLEVGRRAVDAAVPRTRAERFKRWLLREGLTSRAFGPALRLGQAVRHVLPRPLRELVPLPPALGPAPWPAPERQALHARQVVMLRGCVQPALRPHIDAATARVLDACGVRVQIESQAGCCGALHAHLGDEDKAKAAMRRNVDAWWPWVSGSGGKMPARVRAEALIVNASGCGAMIKDYGRWLADDPQYADRARQISAWAMDIGAWLAQQPPATLKRLSPHKKSGYEPGAIAYHPPCSLSHAQGERGVVEGLLRGLGFEVRLAAQDPLQCCGAGGAYSVLQPQTARALREAKLDALAATGCQVVASGNIGCITHLQAGTTTPVRHWIELVDEVLEANKLKPLP